MKLQKLKERMEEIAGEWNGDYPGRLEAKSWQAREVIEHINQIEALVEEMEYL